MDVPSPRSGSATPNSGSGPRYERPLPPIPVPESGPVSWGNERTANVAGANNPPHDLRHIGMGGIYDDDSAAESPGINLHGVDESLLDIYPSRSSSSLSVYASEQQTRSPYLEGVTNRSPRPSFVIDDHSTSLEEPPELSRSSQRERTGAVSDLGPVSPREFLGGAPSTSRGGSPMVAGPSVPTSRFAVDASTSTVDSSVRPREPQGRPQGGVWRQPETRSNASLSVRTPTRRNGRSGPDDDDSSSVSSGNSPLLSHTSPSQIRRRQQPPPPAEFVVPRWQPDAEVTFCPICRTQFSFFVRKHHCRKCGRVVCNACSPHRITIPYQYIVQPPVDGGSPTSSEARSRPRADTAGSSEVTSLGGGERVRLCNPCVPDPNTAPPVNTQRPASYQSHHSRSASTTAVPQQILPGDYAALSDAEIRARIANFPRRPRQPSILENQNRYLDSQNQSRGTSYNDRGLLRPEDFQSRSRSSTVGNSRNQAMGAYPSTSNSNTTLERSHSVRGHPHHRSLIPGPQNSHYPSMSSSQNPPPRRQIPEADECWICHNELPSRDLPDFQTLREAHTEACLAAALQGVSLPPTPTPASNLPPPSPSTSTSTSQDHRPGLASSSSAPPPSTPEARTAAREQAHAAIVMGTHHSTPARRLNGGTIFPYKASEKDLIQDAECSICFEEYVVGQDMGRLECFCRFHLQCIRDWYGKEPGRCPVHDHNRHG